MISLVVQMPTLSVPFPSEKQIRSALNLANDVEITTHEASDSFHHFILRIHVPFSDKKATFFQEKLMRSKLPFTQVWRKR